MELVHKIQICFYTQTQTKKWCGWYLQIKCSTKISTSWKIIYSGFQWYIFLKKVNIIKKINKRIFNKFQTTYFSLLLRKRHGIANDSELLCLLVWVVDMLMFIFFFFFRNLSIYLRETESASSREGQREREKQTPYWLGSRTRTSIQDSGIMTWAEGRCSTD